jgi:hypothetical protein
LIFICTAISQIFFLLFAYKISEIWSFWIKWMTILFIVIIVKILIIFIIFVSFCLTDEALDLLLEIVCFIQHFFIQKFSYLFVFFLKFIHNAFQLNNFLFIFLYILLLRLYLLNFILLCLNHFHQLVVLQCCIIKFFCKFILLLAYIANFILEIISHFIERFLEFLIQLFIFLNSLNLLIIFLLLFF